MLNRLIVLEEVGLVHEIVGRIAIILSRIDGHIEGEIVSGAVEAGSKVDRVQLGHAVPTVVGHLAQFAVETGIEVGGGIYDVGTDLGGGIGVRLPCGDQHVGYVVGLSAEVVDCQRHVELAIDLNGLVSAVGGLKDDVLRGALIAFQLLIADGVGAVALLVAGLCIANTMMMAINERRTEVGILKVLGSELRDIAAMFLTEAAMIGLLGGLVGIGLSFALRAALNGMLSEMDVRSVMPVWLAGFALAFSVVIAVISALIPAMNAMRISPLCAMRDE